MSDNLKLTTEIVALTRAMLEAARSAQWDAVQGQERQRQVLMTNLRVEGLPEGRERGMVMANLQEAAALNTELAELSTLARAELEKAMGVLQRGRRANLAYHGIK